MDPLMGVSDPPEQLSVSPRPWVHFMVHGQALGMLLDLRRGERFPGASHIFNWILALRMQDEDCGRDVAGFSE
jgi:hypothetical protein